MSYTHSIMLVFRKWYVALFLILVSVTIFILSLRVLQATLQPSQTPRPVMKSSSSVDSPPEPIKIIFAGDMMFDRNIRAAAQKQGYDFILEPLRDTLLDADVVVANLEGPITPSASVSLGSVVGSHNNFIFTFDPAVAQTLASFNIKIVNLGNNHILNFGQTGLEQTEGYLEQHGIAYFGNVGTPERDALKGVLEKEIKGVTFLFVNYNEFVRDDPRVIEQIIIQKRPKIDYIIVYTHWGAEYLPEANTVIQELAHGFVDSGADLVIGTHPHVIQQREVYKGKTIYYSLGNFVFDQYFQEEVKVGQLVTLEINPVTKSVTAISDDLVKMEKGGQTVPFTE